MHYIAILSSEVKLSVLTVVCHVRGEVKFFRKALHVEHFLMGDVGDLNLACGTLLKLAAVRVELPNSINDHLT